MHFSCAACVPRFLLHGNSGRLRGVSPLPPQARTMPRTHAKFQGRVCSLSGARSCASGVPKGTYLAQTRRLLGCLSATAPSARHVLHIVVELVLGLVGFRPVHARHVFDPLVGGRRGVAVVGGVVVGGGLAIGRPLLTARWCVVLVPAIALAAEAQSYFAVRAVEDCCGVIDQRAPSGYSRAATTAAHNAPLLRLSPSGLFLSCLSL